MSTKSQRRRWWWVASGFGVGAALGIGLLVGNWFGASNANPRLEIPLHAMSTNSTDSMAMATGLIDNDMEGLFTLDFLSGELQVFVLSPKKANTWVLRGRQNVAENLKIEKGKKANFLMVTGQSNFLKGSDGLQPAMTTVYVCDANSGRVCAYGLRYNKTAYQAVTPSEIGFVLLQGAEGKTITSDP